MQSKDDSWRDWPPFQSVVRSRMKVLSRYTANVKDLET